MTKHDDAMLTMKLVKRDYKNDGFEQDYLNKVIDLVKQAEKQEELLNKIKEIIDRPFDTSSMLEESERYVEIKKLIKELENE